MGEIEGAGFPDWTNLYRRLVCLGPAASYLLLPAVYLGPAELPEVFTCYECVARRSWGPFLDVLLYGGKRIIR